MEVSLAGHDLLADDSRDRRFGKGIRAEQLSMVRRPDYGEGMVDHFLPLRLVGNAAAEAARLHAHIAVRNEIAEVRAGAVLFQQL